MRYTDHMDTTLITDVFLDWHHVYKWDGCYGDTWDPFWADDGHLYAFNCDGRGFGTEPRNLAFNKLEGDSAHSLTGALLNTMDGYGRSNQKEADGATWKTNGQECIDSVFYAFVSRDTYGHESGDPLMRQTAVNSSLIKSMDRGRTWTRTAAENYATPMWPGKAFGAPFFIHYGQNGGQVTRDEADRYVYATSTDGFWNGGDNYVLGRIPRAKLPALNAADWTYYAGGDWSPQVSDATPILSLPAQCGSGPACFISALGVYMMIAWYIPETLTAWFEPTELRYDFYQAAHPWGPWTFIKSVSDRVIHGGRMYGPSLCAKFQEVIGSDVKMSLFTSGCPFEDAPTGIYKLWEIPLTLKTTPMLPATRVPHDDPGIVYAGEWSRADTEIQATQAVGASAEFAFSGTGIDYIAEKSAGYGSVDVFLDGVFGATVDLSLTNFPRLSDVTVFSVRDLPPGRHRIQIVNKSRAGATLEAFSVVGG